MVRRMTDNENIEPEDTPADAPQAPETNVKAETSAPKGERIAKVLARAGVASRREVERMIDEGRIALSGKRLDTPATLVTSLKGIMVDGHPIGEVSQTKLWRCHKRRGTLTTHNDPEGRPTVFDDLPAHMGRVISVGRLDMNTEGLLLFTNDGELARWLELPANSVLRKYRVRVYGRVDEKALEKLAEGATIDGIHYGAIEAKLERQQGTNAWISIAIREGKNREVRRVMEHLGLVVNRLIRTHYGPFSLGTLDVDLVVPVNEKQLYEVMPGYFENAPQAMGTDKAKRDPSKWAKAKKPTGVKPRSSVKKKFEAFKKGDSNAPKIFKPAGRYAEDDKDVPTGRSPKRPSNRINARPAAKGAEKLSGKSTGNFRGKPDEKFTSRPTERTTERSSTKPSARSSERPGERPSGRPNEGFAGKSTGRSAERSAERPAGRTTARTTGRTTERTAEKSTARPGEKRVNPRAGTRADTRANVGKSAHTEKPADRGPRKASAARGTEAARGKPAGKPASRKAAGPAKERATGFAHPKPTSRAKKPGSKK